VSNTRPVFSKALPLLLRYQTPGQMKELAKTRLAGYRYIPTEDGELSEVYSAARRVYSVLAQKLGDKLFFYGDSPSSLDAG
jgi:hypothetical protein